MADNPRDLAYQIIHRVNFQGAFLNLLIRSSLDESKMPERDRGLVTELCYGVARLRNRLDFAIAHFSSRPLDQIDPALLDLLRLGVFQLLETRVSAHAAVNETVNLAQKYTNPGAAKMANAVLRACANSPESIPWPGREDMVQYLSVVLSYPEWMAAYLIRNFGEETAERICAAGNDRAPLCMRVNTLKGSREEMEEWLSSQRIAFRRSSFVPDGLANIDAPVGKLKRLLRDGLAIFQDESSMLVPYMLDPRRGQLIIDACAAPGGKATHLAQLTEDRARILAVDLNRQRLKAMGGSIKRLGVKSVKSRQGDSTRLASVAGQQADGILVDAPCSGLGTLRRRPELKWRRVEGDLAELAELQSKLLEGATPVLANGGLLVYSACTISREETVEVVDAFLGRHPEFQAERAAEHCPLGCPADAEVGDHLQLMTHLHNTDGMFMARLRKSG